MTHLAPIRTLALVAVLCAPAADALAGVGQWTPVGPPNGTGHAIAIDPTSPSRLYASIDETVFESTDGAASWVATGPGLPNDWVHQLIVDPSSRVYAATDSQGLFVSNDAGASWSPANTGLPAGSAGAIAVDPTTAGTAYLTTGATGLFKTVDGGATWTASGSGLGATSVLAVAVDPTTPTALYAGGHPSGAASAALFTSTDGGASWSPTALSAAAFGDTDMTVLQVVIAPSAPATVYARVSTAEHGRLIVKSVDGGGSFTAVGSPVAGVNTLAVDPASAARLLAGTPDGVFTSLDGGVSWTRTSIGIAGLSFRTILGLAIDAGDPAIVYVTGLGDAYQSGDGVFKSTDGGGHWASASVGFPRDRLAGEVALAPGAPSRVYTVSFGLYASDDAGRHWNRKNLGIARSASTLAIDPLTPETIYASDGITGMYKSTDRGATWSPASSGLGALGVQAILVDPTAPSTVYAATTGGVFRSGDGAASWTAASAGLSSLDVQSLAIDPTMPATLYAGTRKGVSKTSDAGATWTATALVLDDHSNLVQIPVPMLLVDASGTVYASTAYETFVPPATFDGFAHLQKSTDGGASWTITESGLGTNPVVRALAIDPVTPTTRYVGTSSTVFRSVDGGDTWAPYGTGIPGGATVEALAIDPSRPSWVYAGTWHGLQRIEGPCAVDADCDDGNPCTADACNVGDGSCAHAAAPNGGACDDDDACTAASTCQVGACTPTAPPPVCEDGVVCTDDTCSPTTGLCVSVPRPTGGACDDGSSCTTDDQCDAGTCGGTPVACDPCLQCQEGAGCVAAPRGGCAGPRAKGSALALRESDQKSDQLKWKWQSAGTTSKADFGDPLDATTYALCVYDTSAGLPRLLQLPPPTGPICPADGCWRETHGGYKLRAGFFNTLKLGASSSGKGTITVVGRSLTFLSGSPFLPMTIDPKVIVQLQRNDAPGCWEAEFATSRVNEVGRFEAKLP